MNDDLTFGEPLISEPPTMFTDLTAEELRTLWDFLSTAPAKMYEIYGTGNRGVFSEVTFIFWEVSVEMDFRD